MFLQRAGRSDRVCQGGRSAGKQDSKPSSEESTFVSDELCTFTKRAHSPRTGGGGRGTHSTMPGQWGDQRPVPPLSMPLCSPTSCVTRGNVPSAGAGNSLSARTLQRAAKPRPHGLQLDGGVSRGVGTIGSPSTRPTARTVATAPVALTMGSAQAGDIPQGRAAPSELIVSRKRSLWGLAWGRETPHRPQEQWGRRGQTAGSPS